MLLKRENPINKVCGMPMTSTFTKNVILLLLRCKNLRHVVLELSIMNTEVLNLVISDS